MSNLLICLALLALAEMAALVEGKVYIVETRSNKNSRRRELIEPHGGSDYAAWGEPDGGKWTTTAPCTGGYCSCSWSKWTDGPCSTTCDPGHKTRQRTCSCGTGQCPGKHSEHTACNENVPCQTGPYAAAGWGMTTTTKAPCTWAYWGPWSHPANTCTSSKVERTRKCETKEYESTGTCYAADCPGNGVEAKTVPGGVCCSWSKWSEGRCSTTCGLGHIKRQRTCKCVGGSTGQCPGNHSEQRACNEDVACPTAPGWSTTTQAYGR